MKLLADQESVLGEPLGGLVLRRLASGELGSNLRLRAQVFDPLADDVTQIRGRQAVGDFNGFSAQLGELLIKSVKTRADALIILKVLTASQDIIVDLFQTLAQPSAFLAETLPQMIDVEIGRASCRERV